MCTHACTRCCTAYGPRIDSSRCDCFNLGHLRAIPFALRPDTLWQGVLESYSEKIKEWLDKLGEKAKVRHWCTIVLSDPWLVAFAIARAHMSPRGCCFGHD